MIRKIKEFIIDLWNDKEVSEREWEFYYKYKAKLRECGQSSSDVPMPMCGRDLIIGTGIIIIMSVLGLIFI